MKKTICILLLLVLAGCVATQERNNSIYPIEGRWKISGVKQGKKYVALNFEEDEEEIVFVFSDNTFNLVVGEQPLFDDPTLDKVSYTVKNEKIVLSNSAGEKFTANIEFFDPTSLRVSKFRATREAGLVAMSVKAALTGKLLDEDISWVNNAFLYFSKVQNYKKSLPKEHRFYRDENGIVYDKQTNLEWYAGPEKNTSWDEAKHWASALDLAGGGWRLPSINELKSLYQSGVHHNKTPLLTPQVYRMIWSNDEKDSLNVFYFNFGDGQIGSFTRDFPYSFRAFGVRSRE